MDSKSIESDIVFRHVGNQYFAAFTSNLIMFAYGCMIGWVSPAISVLMSDSTPLESGPITMEEASWIGSVVCIGCVAGTFIWGYLCSLIGAKRAMYFITLPPMTFWLMIIFGQTPLTIIFARFISGLTGGAIYACNLLFIADIADRRIRGTLSSITQLSRNVGVLISFIIGLSVDYHTLPYIYMFLPLVFLCTFIFLPNSPQFFIRKNQFEEARRSLKFYKGCSGNDETENRAFEDEFNRLVGAILLQQKDEQIHLKDLCLPGIARKFIVAGIFITFAQMTGAFNFITYSVMIFEKSGAEISPSTSTVILAIVQIAGALMTTYFVDRLGRKVLMASSMIGCTIGLLSMAIYLYLDDQGVDLFYFNWVPVMSLALVVLLAAVGVTPLTMVYVVETMPSKLRGFALATANVYINIVGFGVVKYFPIMMDRFGMIGCMLAFGTSCAMAFVFVVCAMEETMGKDLDADENDMVEPKDEHNDIENVSYEKRV